MKTNLPPSHLSPDGKVLFTKVTCDYQLEEHQLRLLQLACEAWDLAQEARAQIAKDGITIEGREGGIRQHPCVAVARDSSCRFAALIRQLGFDEEDVPPVMGRPTNSTKFATSWNRYEKIKA
jgi:P27 family predicted phage terminase small subunit